MSTSVWVYMSVAGERLTSIDTPPTHPTSPRSGPALEAVLAQPRLTGGRVPRLAGCSARATSASARPPMPRIGLYWMACPYPTLPPQVLPYSLVPPIAR